MSGLEINELDEAAERAILAEILTDPETAWDMTEILVPQDFSIARNRLLYSTIVHLMESGQTPDVLTITAHLEKNKQLRMPAEQAIMAISDIASATPTGSVTSYAAVIKERATLRRIHRVAGELYKLADTPGLTGEAAMAKAEELVLSASEDPARDADTSVPLAQAAQEYLEYLRTATSTEMVGISTGFAALDEATLGWCPGDLVVIGATPGSGKSSYLLQTAMVTAQQTGKPVVILSHEMTRREITERALAALLKAPLRQLRTGKLSREDEQAIMSAIEVADKLNIIINDNPPVDYTGLESWMRRTQRKTPLGGVVLDYLQQMVEPQRENRAKFLGSVCYLMKRLAKNGQYPAFIASQLNRSISQRADPTPKMSDLRESGDIEASANTILLIHRDEDNPNSDPTEAKIFIGKQRAGESRTHAILKWNGPTLTFHNDPKYPSVRKNTGLTQPGQAAGGMPAPY